MTCLSENCEQDTFEADLCREHYKAGLKADRSPLCGVCPGRMREMRGTAPKAFGKSVVRMRECMDCKRTQVTVEVMLSVKQLARTGEAMLGDYFGRMHADSATTAPSDGAASAASTGKTTAGASAS